MTRLTWLRFFATLMGAVCVPRFVRSEEFLSLTEAQRLLFPGGGLRKLDIKLSPEQKRAIERASRERVRDLNLQVWRAGDGGWFIVDKVLGKHEFITYALALSPGGAVKGVEILTYRETYGDEVRLPGWRAQFADKTAAAPVRVDSDIRNISGATLSCVHVTDGIRRLLHTHALVLRNL